MNKHNAPSVVYPIGRSRTLTLIFLGVWLAGFALICLWVQTQHTMAWPQVAGFLAVLVAGLAGLRALRNSPQGHLAWDGQHWRWESASYQAGHAEYALTVEADFQHVLLLQVNNKAHARLWFWVERSAFPSRWLDLRRAVYSPHRGLHRELAAQVMS